LADPSRVDIRGKVSVGKDVFIDVNGAVGRCFDTHDRSALHIKDSRIGAGTEVFASCVMDRAVRSQLQYRPVARLRPEAELADHVISATS
jgi:bifunctional UDP-N-acetylglucosamine pyrophosphorylase/glucosamine-1-phosphate N-acetyltransferase